MFSKWQNFILFNYTGVFVPSYICITFSLHIHLLAVVSGAVLSMRMLVSLSPPTHTLCCLRPLFLLVLPVCLPCLFILFLSFSSEQRLIFYTWLSPSQKCSYVSLTLFTVNVAWAQKWGLFSFVHLASSTVLHTLNICSRCWLNNYVKGWIYSWLLHPCWLLPLVFYSCKWWWLPAER